MNLPRFSDLTDAQQVAILSTTDDGRLSGLTHRLTVRALRRRGLVTGYVGSPREPVRLTLDGRTFRAELEQHLEFRRLHGGGRARR